MSVGSLRDINWLNYLDNEEVIEGYKAYPVTKRFIRRHNLIKVSNTKNVYRYKNLYVYAK